MQVSVTIRVVQVAKRYVALTTLGGILVRGKVADDQATALRNLFWELAGQGGKDDALLAVDLLAAGQDIQAELALTDGTKPQ